MSSKLPKLTTANPPKLTAAKGSSDELHNQATTNATSWSPRRKLDLEEWLFQGKRLGAIGKGTAWWIGDWVNYGNAKFGEKYDRAARITGYDTQSLMNMAYVASRFEISRRRENLSWSHHSELAAYSLEEQDRWLRFIEEKGLSVHSLRAELRAHGIRRGEQNESNKENNVPGDCEATKQLSAEPRQSDTTHEYSPDVEDRSIVCPNCGRAIAVSGN